MSWVESSTLSVRTKGSHGAREGVGSREEELKSHHIEIDMLGSESQYYHLLTV